MSEYHRTLGQLAAARHFVGVLPGRNAPTKEPRGEGKRSVANKARSFLSMDGVIANVSAVERDTEALLAEVAKLLRRAHQVFPECTCG